MRAYPEDTLYTSNNRLEEVEGPETQKANH